MLFLIANSFPFLSLELGGRQVDSLLISSSWVMYELGMGELGILIFITSVLFPFLVIIGMLFLLTAARFGKFPPFAGPVYRLVSGLMPWSLIGVFLLGTLI
jgi:paraquat-inducible protein A